MSDTTTAPRETLEFKTELKQLLHLITHSLYSNREIFLRELISNASDAIYKVKFDSLDSDDRLEGDKDWKIKLIPDKEAGTLTIRDNGVGMDREGVVADLGTIARSGTKAFLENLKRQNAENRPGLIGQFGVGFYSAFMVADKVTVLTRRAGSPADTATRWESDGQGEFTVEPAEKATRGTDVTLHLKEDAKEYLEPWTLKSLVRKFSDFVEHPITMDLTTKGEGEDAPEETSEETLNSRKAIWIRNRSEVKPEEYTEFYKSVSGDTDEPARVIHIAAEGKQEYKALMFLPAHKPFSYQFEDPKPGLKLYIQRVLIMDPCEATLPRYLRFVRGVVDSADLPLNISRELLQSNPLLESIQRNLVKNVLDGIAALRNTEPEKFTTFYKEFGQFLKEGVASDYGNREKLADLLQFESANTPAGEQITLKQYIERMPEGQAEIYYLVGESRQQLAHSPYLERFTAKGYDVLFLTDSLIDEYFVPSLWEFQKKKLTRADKADLKLEGDAEVTEEEKSAFGAVVERFKTVLSEVGDVRLSKRMTDSAACLVADASAMPPHLERYFRQMGRDAEIPGAKKTLELNPAHPAVAAVRDRLAANADDPRIEVYAQLIYDQAVLAEGGKPADPAALARRVNELLVRDAGR